MNEWRQELSREDLALLDRALSTIEDWHEGAVDCYQWQSLVAHLVKHLDEYQDFVRMIELDAGERRWRS